jgi:hypothetical protein
MIQEDSSYIGKGFHGTPGKGPGACVVLHFFPNYKYLAGVGAGLSSSSLRTVTMAGRKAFLFTLYM